LKKVELKVISEARTMLPAGRSPRFFPRKLPADARFRKIIFTGDLCRNPKKI
jgi:hypothetical protein